MQQSYIMSPSQMVVVPTPLVHAVRCQRQVSPLHPTLLELLANLVVGVFSSTS